MTTAYKDHQLTPSIMMVQDEWGDLDLEWKNEATDHWNGSYDKAETITLESAKIALQMLQNFIDLQTL